MVVVAETGGCDEEVEDPIDESMSSGDEAAVEVAGPVGLGEIEVFPNRLMISLTAFCGFG